MYGPMLIVLPYIYTCYLKAIWDQQSLSLLDVQVFPSYRLVDMFTRVLSSEKKEYVIHSFSEVGGTLRVVIATTAFGMGVDCPDIR